MSERPPAAELLPEMVELLPEPGPKTRPKLKPHVQKRAAEARCRKRRHLLAAVVPHPHGMWLLHHGGVWGYGWRAEWLDDLPDPAALKVWCAPCEGMVWTVDLSDPAHPRVLR